MALWSDVGPVICDDNRSYFCQNIPEKLHRHILMNSLKLFLVKGQSRVSVTMALKASSFELVTWNCRTLLSTNRQPVLPPLWPASSETLVLEKPIFPLNMSTNTVQVPENSEKAPCFPFQVGEAAGLLSSDTSSRQAHARDWTENHGRTHYSNRVGGDSSITDKEETTFVLDKCFVWERTKSFSPSPDPILVAGIAALELPSLPPTRPKEQSI